MQNDPVVVPRRHPPRLLERRIRIPVRSRPVDRAVVEEDERALQPRNHQVLVVTRIGHDRRAARVARQILEHPARLDPQLRPVGRVVELRTRDRTRPIHRVEVERRRAPVRRAARIGRNSHHRARVERDVVIDELPQKRRPRRVTRIVRIVHAQAEIRDQQPRPLAQVVVRVERPARRAQRAQRIPDPVRRRREDGQVGKEPAERRRARRHGPASRRLGAWRERTAAGDRDRARANPRALQEPTPAVAHAHGRTRRVSAASSRLKRSGSSRCGT